MAGTNGRNGKKNGKAGRVNKRKNTYTDPDNNGDFAAGNPGRPKGSKNKTVSIARIRQDILDSWETVGGPDRLKLLAEKNFAGYLFAISKFVPKPPIEVTMTTPITLVKQDVLVVGTVNFIGAIQSSDGGRVTPEAVLDALDKHSRGELPMIDVGPTNGRKGKNESTPTV